MCNHNHFYVFFLSSLLFSDLKFYQWIIVMFCYLFHTYASSMFLHFYLFSVILETETSDITNFFMF